VLLINNSSVTWIKKPEIAFGHFDRDENNIFFKEAE